MGRWICIDDICIPSDENDWEELVAFADAIAEQEPIDIVRCGECIHCADDWNGNQPMFTCELGRCGESVQPNDFCSYGSRSEKPNNSTRSKKEQVGKE